MDRKKLQELLKSVSSGKVGIHEAMEALKYLPYQDLGFAKIDHHRSLRRGVPEVVFCQTKTVTQVVEISRKIIQAGDELILTRVSEKMVPAVRAIDRRISHHEMARMMTLVRKRRPKKGLIAVLSAGTSDMPVAEEARVTAEALGNRVETLYDVGVAGIHRLFSAKDLMAKARVFVVVAGMEGALASVVGGLVSRPIIAVPTSIGYGASFQGLAALLGMLNSCASGVTVVNIDNGFGAGFTASLINQL
ncbi:MAG: 1-(5-phosphoribosyl)-5-amino-4-imidazole-carboxylate carboxylase [Candidatus Glassbacteria bacterium RBG_16_58_8]|uniref:1-(5-phosphoribosyl)-5-amino-4-imidazole-carboxylate carboxylase n=1 Tax=Candidatus Glassbacteria bacterium RBG_16_58_8 TaxID=1817866 RepID=A0A1F5YCE4_9BACT|nr:MAG: 1-(5-phosphoribosyl)-5-amino-4-imidazole-carboxylate carboxylase [Candidatus Glassbacteria bacterium RBG_16_58_8]